MADFDYERTMRAICDAVNDSEGVAEGMSRLLEFGRTEAPRDAVLWNEFARRDFAANARQFCDAFGAALQSSPIPANYNGLYFGLDGLNMPNGKGIEFGCSETFDEANDDGGVEWAYDGSYYPFEIPSPLLSALYGQVKPASFADYVICIPYLGLAVREAMWEHPAEKTLGRAQARAICWGPHDGDLFRLGTLRRDGLVCDCR